MRNLTLHEKITIKGILSSFDIDKQALAKGDVDEMQYVWDYCLGRKLYLPLRDMTKKVSRHHDFVSGDKVIFTDVGGCYDIDKNKIYTVDRIDAGDFNDLISVVEVELTNGYYPWRLKHCEGDGYE